MLAFQLGDIRTFPFIDPPSDTAIRGGYRLLEELDAVYSDSRSENEDDYRLTKLGRKLARLPVDPTVARMLLQAQREGVIEDVLVIASGLSIQDPRERPAELAKEADEMQKRFVHKESDFLTLLNIWNAYHDEIDRLSQGQLLPALTSEATSPSSTQRASNKQQATPPTPQPSLLTPRLAAKLPPTQQFTARS